MRRSILLLLLLFLSVSVVTCFSQQEDVARYSAFGAFSYLSTPSLNLTQRGFDGDFGVNLRSWFTIGGDFSYNSGSSTLLPSSLNSATQAKLAPVMSILPPGFALAVPYNSATYTYEAGPQFNYRKLQHFTFFVRPALGALHADFTAKPGRCAQPELECGAILTQVVNGLLNGKTSTSDTVVFYGFGGGITWEATRNFGLRVATDFVHYNFFSNLLDGGRNSVRVVVGTKYSWGRNIIK